MCDVDVHRCVLVCDVVFGVLMCDVHINKVVLVCGVHNVFCMIVVHQGGTEVRG